MDTGSNVDVERSIFSPSTLPQVGSVIASADFPQLGVNSTTDDDVIDAATVDSWTIVRISVSAFIAVSSLAANGLLLAAATAATRRRRNRVDRKHQSSRDARSDLATVECGTTASTMHVSRTSADGLRHPTSLEVVGDRRDTATSPSVIVHLQSTAAAGVTSGILSAFVCVVSAMTAANSTTNSARYFACHPIIRSTFEGLAAGIPTVCLYGHIAALVDRHLALSLRPPARYQHLVGGYCRARLVAAVIWLYSVLVAAASALRRAVAPWELRLCGRITGGLLDEGSGLNERRFTIISFAAGLVVSFMIVFSVVYQRCERCKRNRKSTTFDADDGDLPDRKRFRRVTNRCRLDVAVIVAHVTGVALWSADVFFRNVGLVGSDVIHVVIGSSRDAEIVQQMALLCGLTVGVLMPCVYLTVGNARP